MFGQFLKILNPINLLDITIVAFVIYKLMMLLRGTRAVQLLKGLVVLLVATIISKFLGLQSINWILEKLQTGLLIALPIVFQPELRRALEQLGRGRIFTKTNGYVAEEEAERLISEIVRSVKVMAKNKIGALIVIERETGLNDLVETGIRIDGLVSGELLTNIFIPNTPLHDGAVIIRDDKILSASCFLPLSENRNLSKELGTRHRAGIGVTEVSDALVVFVSEETGVISVAEEGKLTRYLDEITLKEILINKTKPQQKSVKQWWRL
ncbi:diadenylate cyclase [Desulfonispora thiosulfatigenes DSM 11270]|uniref:Diadenylate cyclase n=1 Tax=Desulfonispora thiosulfatigenes DSM 11270 TaxID=656914 RepID=A0A1W1V868_DESTI|nr:diadenylate cyclase CdaA [Desulfonispora thiosulfatigenes]SMB89558.1 diadenylate cyclase [Desulfonispora thiosulfatigenes DSM 11270]